MKIRIMLTISLLILSSVACKFGGAFFQEMGLSATNNPIPTDTPLPSATPIPTNTPQPTPTTAPSPVPPTRAPNTPVPLPAIDPSTDTPEPSVTFLHVTNRLGKAAKYTLRGPEIRSFTVSPLATYDTEITPGTYSYTIKATGYNEINGTITFGPGDFDWSLGHD